MHPEVSVSVRLLSKHAQALTWHTVERPSEEEGPLGAHGVQFVDQGLGVLVWAVVKSQRQVAGGRALRVYGAWSSRTVENLHWVYSWVCRDAGGQKRCADDRPDSHLVTVCTVTTLTRVGIQVLLGDSPAHLGDLQTIYLFKQCRVQVNQPFQSRVELLRDATVVYLEHTRVAPYFPKG